MDVTLRPLTAADAAAHCAGEDDETVRWLTGTRGTVEGTVAYFEVLAANARRGTGKRGFGVCLDGRLAGYVDCDPAPEPRTGEGVSIGAGDVNVAYAVHPWARRRGVATAAVRLVCEVVIAERLGTRALIQVEPENLASARVAQRAGFRRAGRCSAAAAGPDPDRVPTFDVYVRDLPSRSDG